MGNPLIGYILKSLLSEYNSGACDNMGQEEEKEITDILSSLRDKLSDKQDKVLTVEEASRYLNCTRQTLNNYVRSGKLNPRKHLGGVIEFRLKDLKEFIRSNKLKR